MATMTFQEYQTKLGRDPNAPVTSGYKQYLFNQTGGSQGTDYGVKADPGGSGRLVSKSTGNVITDTSWAKGNKTAAAGNPNASKTPYRDTVAPNQLGGGPSSAPLVHHYNPASQHGFGSAVVLNPGVSANAVNVGGVQFVKHGNLDEGREVWYDPNRRQGINGPISISSGGKTYGAGGGGGAKQPAAGIVPTTGGGGGGGVAQSWYSAASGKNLAVRDTGETRTSNGYQLKTFEVENPYSGQMVKVTGVWDGKGWTLKKPAGAGSEGWSEMPHRLTGGAPGATAGPGGGGPAPAPPPVIGGGSGGGGSRGSSRPSSASGDRSVEQTGDLAYTRDVVKPETQDDYETVQGQLQGLLSDGNPYVERARHMGRESAAARGLLNSSISAQAAEAAAIDAALPIASQDASTFFNQAMNNQNAVNRFRAMGLSHEQAMQMAEISHGFAMEQLELQSKLGLSSSMALMNAEHANRLQLSYLDAQMQIQMDPYLTPEQQVIAGNRAGQLWGQGSYYASSYL